VKLSCNVMPSGSEVADGVGTMIGDDVDVSENFCGGPEIGKEEVFLVCWLFMNQDIIAVW
jgi:hypothetical protein